MKAFRIVAEISEFMGTFADRSKGQREETIVVSNDRAKIEKAYLDLFGPAKYSYTDTPYIEYCKAHKIGTFEYNGKQIPLIPVDRYYGDGSLDYATIEEFDYVSESEFI